MSETPRALVVEDERAWRQILSEMLADAGLAVDVAHDLESAVRAAKSAPHRLAVVDLALSGGDYNNHDGLRVLDAIRRADPGCVAIMLTGFATVELAVSVLSEYGAITCLRKETFNRAEFREWVDRALASARPFAVNGEAKASHDGVAEAAEKAGDSPPLALVVEDDAGWRSILGELLADAGYDVRACSSFGEATGILLREEIAVAVVDLSLSGALAMGASGTAGLAPGDDFEGYRLLRRTRAAGIPTIVVSGVATPTDVERTYQEEGILAYLEKQTFRRQAFLDAISDARDSRFVSSALDDLTERERQVLELLARGLTNKEIAHDLVITTNTVKRHLKAIFGKLQVHTRSAATSKAIGSGLRLGSAPGVGSPSE